MSEIPRNFQTQLSPEDKPVLAKSSDIDVFVGERLMFARTTMGISIAELAHEVGIGATDLVAIESGAQRPAPLQLYRLAKIFGLMLSDLFGG